MNDQVMLRWTRWVSVFGYGLGLPMALFAQARLRRRHRTTGNSGSDRGVLFKRPDAPRTRPQSAVGRGVIRRRRRSRPGITSGTVPESDGKRESRRTR